MKAITVHTFGVQVNPVEKSRHQNVRDEFDFLSGWLGPEPKGLCRHMYSNLKSLNWGYTGDSIGDFCPGYCGGYDNGSYSRYLGPQGVPIPLYTLGPILESYMDPKG